VLALLHKLEVFYGGAAGGGKTDLLLRAALQFVDFPGYKALLLRRTYPELAQPGGLIDRAHEWLAGRARWNEQKHRWTFPSGAVLEFGYLHRSTDKFRYQGSEFDFIGFDELTHFDEPDYLYLFSRLRRREGSPIPPRMRGASNPGGRGHRWVKRRFIERKPDPENPEDTPEKCAERVFIPAKLTDNPGIDQDAYRASLAQLDTETRAQLLDGDWDAREPGAWVFDHLAIRAAIELGAMYDQLRKGGKLPPSVNHEMATGTDYGDFATVQEIGWPLERGGLYLPPGEVATSREDLEAITDKFVDAVAPYAPPRGHVWWAEQRYDSSFAQSNRTFLKLAEKRLGRHNPVKRTGRPNTYPVNFGKYKDLTIRYLRLLLRRTLEAKEAGWPEGQAMTRVLAISPRNEVLCDQLPEYEEGEDGKPVKGNDDAIDALIALANRSARAHRKIIDAETRAASNGGVVEAFKAAGRA
jgi:hypothetical protein